MGVTLSDTLIGGLYEVLSGAMICIPSFIKIGSGIRKLGRGGGGYTDTQAAW
jgi:hypothetical protein